MSLEMYIIAETNILKSTFLIKILEIINLKAVDV